MMGEEGWYEYILFFVRPNETCCRILVRIAMILQRYSKVIYMNAWLYIIISIYTSSNKIISITIGGATRACHRP